jgi:hypothetical protein
LDKSEVVCLHNGSCSGLAAHLPQAS